MKEKVVNMLTNTLNHIAMQLFYFVATAALVMYYAKPYVSI